VRWAKAWRRQRDQGIHTPGREADAESAAEQGEQRGFREQLPDQLPDQLPPTGTECGADRELAPPRRATGQHHAGYVGRGDEENEPDRPQEDEQCGAELVDQGFLERYDRDAPVPVRGRIFRRETGSHRLEARRRVLERAALAQAADHLIGVKPARFQQRRIVE